MSYVLITTEQRGVYVGEIVDNRAPKSVVLQNARCCVRWELEDDGFLYLAVHGPEGVAQVSPEVAHLQVFGVCTIAECTKEAEEAWRAA